MVMDTSDLERFLRALLDSRFESYDRASEALAHSLKGHVGALDAIRDGYVRRIEHDLLVSQISDLQARIGRVETSLRTLYLVATLMTAVVGAAVAWLALLHK